MSRRVDRAVAAKAATTRVTVARGTMKSSDLDDSLRFGRKRRQRRDHHFFSADRLERRA